MGEGIAGDAELLGPDARAFCCPACGAIVGRLVRRILDVDAELGQLVGAVYTCAGCEGMVRLVAPKRADGLPFPR